VLAIAKKKPTDKERLARAREKIGAAIDPELAKAIADPLRYQMLMTALQRPLSGIEFAEEWDIPEHASHHHITFLRKRGFLVVVDEVKRRGATEIFYRAVKRAYLSDAAWAQIGPILHNGLSETIMNEFFNVVSQAGKAKTLDARPESHLWWQEIPLDEITFPKAMAMLRVLVNKLLELGDETVANQAEGEGGELIQSVLGLMGFESAPPEKPSRRKPRHEKPKDGKRRKGGRK
jgi:hypothetical protein